MIVECPACQTRYRLDETKIKGRGARVRCRRCGEAIVVMKPEPQSPSPPPRPRSRSLDLAAALRESAWQPPQATPSPPARPSPPAVPREESVPDLREEAAPAAEPAAKAAPPPREAPLEPDSSQPAAPAAGIPPWEITEPAPAPEAPKDEVDAAFDRMLSEPPPGGAIPPEEESQAVEGPDVETAPAPEVAPRASIEEETASPAPESSPAIGRPSEFPGPAVDFAAEERITFAPEEILPPRPGTPESRPFEIVHRIEEQMEEGAPSEAGADTSTPAPPPPGPTEERFLREEKRSSYDITAALMARPEAGPAEEVPTAVKAAADDRTRIGDVQEELMIMGAEPPPTERKAPDQLMVPLEPWTAHPPSLGGHPSPARPKNDFGRPLVGGLIALFLVLAAGGAWLGFTKGGQETLRGLLTRTEPWLRGSRQAAPAYNVSNVIGYYETSARAGKLFVIKGQVTNASSIQKHSIQVVATLMDAKGQTVAQTAVTAGNALAGDFLRQASRDKIEGELSNPIGQGLQNIDVPPGKTLPFTAVFFDAPAGIDAYRLEAKDGV